MYLKYFHTRSSIGTLYWLLFFWSSVEVKPKFLHREPGDRNRQQTRSMRCLWKGPFARAIGSQDPRMMKRNKWHSSSSSRPVISCRSVMITSVEHVLWYWMGLFVCVRPPRETLWMRHQHKSSFNTSPLIQQHILGLWGNTGLWMANTNRPVCPCLSPARGVLIKSLMTQLYKLGWPRPWGKAVVYFFHIYSFNNCFYLGVFTVRRHVMHFSTIRALSTRAGKFWRTCRECWPNSDHARKTWIIFKETYNAFVFLFFPLRSVFHLDKKEDKKGQSLHQQKFHSPTGNTAPETPRR